MNEDELVILAREGRPEAFRRLYDLHWDRIYRIAFRHLRSRPDAEDILQETFIKAFRFIRTYKLNRGSGFAAWLNTICLNCTLDFHRKQHRRHRDRKVSLSDFGREIRSGNPSPERRVVLGQAAERIKRAMTVLSPRQRLVFEMRFFRHMEVREIAEDLKCSQSNVKTQISRALEKLRKILKPVWGEP